MAQTTRDVLKKSESMYAQLVDVYPADPRFLKRYSEVLSKLGKVVQAEKAVEKLYILLLHMGEQQSIQDLEKEYPMLLQQQCVQQQCDFTFLSYVSSSLLDRLIMLLQRRKLKEGEYLCRAGEDGQSMFIIVEGEMSVFLPQGKAKRPVMLGLLKRGDVVGEMAMLQSGMRNADVVAMSGCKVLELKRQHFLKIIDEHGALESSIMRDAELRLRMNQISKNHILARLPMKERKRLAQHAMPFYVPHQECIAEEGTLIKHVLLVTDGVADFVYNNHCGVSHWLYNFRIGDLLGEQALVDNPAFPADIIAATDVQFLQLSIEILQDLMGAYPWMRTHLASVIDGYTITAMKEIGRVRTQ